jgi:hypothetical protein
MQIEAGKFYQTRGCGVVGPIHKYYHHLYCWVAYMDDRAISYTREGHYIGPDDKNSLDLVSEYSPPAAEKIDRAKGYAPLVAVLNLALEQASAGKGRDRHSDDKPFLEQPIMEIARMLNGTGGHAYQIMKKAQEASRMVARGQHDAAVAEYLGVINYAAAAVLLIRERGEAV